MHENGGEVEFWCHLSTRVWRAKRFLTRKAGEGDRVAVEGANARCGLAGYRSCHHVMRMRAPVITQKRARSLRRTMSLPEVLIWTRLRGRSPRFRRQHPIGPFILDFFCAARALAVEIDGQHHDPDADARRDAWLAEKGIRTVRIPASDVLRDPDAAAEFILSQES